MTLDRINVDCITRSQERIHTLDTSISHELVIFPLRCKALSGMHKKLEHFIEIVKLG